MRRRCMVCGPADKNGIAAPDAVAERVRRECAEILANTVPRGRHQQSVVYSMPLSSRARSVVSTFV
jgi:hypothetical protein